MKKIILLTLLFPLLALAENSLMYVYNNKVYKIVAKGGDKYQLYGMDQSGKQQRLRFFDGGSSTYSKAKLVGIFKMESDKTPYYEFRSDQRIKEISLNEFEKKLNEIDANTAPFKPYEGPLEANTSCQEITECQGESGSAAYVCLYDAMKMATNSEASPKCKELISMIGEKAFKPLLNDDCAPEKISQCDHLNSYDLYSCLARKKNQSIIPKICKDAIGAAKANLDRLSSISFPSQVADAKKPDYGFGAKPIKTGFSPSGSEIQVLRPKTGIR